MRCIGAHDLPVVFLNALAQLLELGHQGQGLHAEAFDDHFIGCAGLGMPVRFEPFFNGLRVSEYSKIPPGHRHGGHSVCEYN